MSTTAGARIKLIPYGDEPRKPAYALILGLAILISLGSMVMVVIEGSMRWVVVIAAVVLLGFVAAVIDARMTRRGWVKAPARVIDREILADFGATEAGPSYNFQLLCEVEYRGERYHVTPLPNWMSLPRPQLEALLARAISSDDRCQLWVNPKLPKQTELSTGGARDWFMFGRR